MEGGGGSVGAPVCCNWCFPLDMKQDASYRKRLSRTKKDDIAEKFVDSFFFTRLVFRSP